MVFRLEDGALVKLKVDTNRAGISLRILEFGQTLETSSTTSGIIFESNREFNSMFRKFTCLCGVVILLR